MESQIRIGWTTEPPLYVSHEHSAFQQQDVKKYKPVGHQITKSKVKLKYQRGSPQDYVSATHEHFPDRSATVKSDRESGELGTRIMGDRRQRHTVPLPPPPPFLPLVSLEPCPPAREHAWIASAAIWRMTHHISVCSQVTVQRGDMDGPYSRNNKYLEDFLDVDTGAHAPTLIRKGKVRRCRAGRVFASGLRSLVATADATAGLTCMGAGRGCCSKERRCRSLSWTSRRRTIRGRLTPRACTPRPRSVCMGRSTWSRCGGRRRISNSARRFVSNMISHAKHAVGIEGGMRSL